MDFSLLFVICVASLQVIYALPPVVEIRPQRTTVMVGNSLTAICRVGIPISYCRWTIPGLAPLNLNPQVGPHEGVQYNGQGLDKGECGVLIRNVKDIHNGNLQCNLGFVNFATESTGSLSLTVAREPQTPQVLVTGGDYYSNNAFKEGETIQAQCVVAKGRPVANITWFIGSEQIYSGLTTPQTIDEGNGLKTITQNITRQLKYTDHGKDLRCVAGHIAFGPNSIPHSLYKLNIKFPPKPTSRETEQFGFNLNQPGRVTVTFHANPLPSIEWEVEKEKLLEGAWDSSRRFRASVLANKGSGTWVANLDITSVTSDDVEKKYTLHARNDLGHETYKVAISTRPEPPADITAGAIAGIVIAALFILLLIFILIFARATGRWCFAAGTNENKSSSEAAIEDGTEEKRPPSIQGKDGVYSSTEYINGSDKKKCSNDKINTPV